MRSNLLPKKWGPHAWYFLESVALGLPDKPCKQDKLRIKKWFILLQYMLPCEKCRYHYKTHLDNNPLTDEILSSKASIFNWILKVHSLASQKEVNYQDSMEFYLKEYDGQVEDGTGQGKIAAGIVGLVVLGMVYLFIMRKN